jgi:hypothetical protein
MIKKKKHSAAIYWYIFRYAPPDGMLNEPPPESLAPEAPAAPEEKKQEKVWTETFHTISVQILLKTKRRRRYGLRLSTQFLYKFSGREKGGEGMD